MEPERIGAQERLTAAERKFLIDAGSPADSFDPEIQAVARDRLRARAAETRRKASPELTANQVAGLLGCSRPQVYAWAQSQDLYAITAEVGMRFPEWQFPDSQRLPELGCVLRELTPDLHPYSVEGLLAQVPHEELDDMTAVAWLAAGGAVDAAVALAVSSNYDM